MLAMFSLVLTVYILHGNPYVCSSVRPNIVFFGTEHDDHEDFWVLVSDCNQIVSSRIEYNTEENKFIYTSALHNNLDMNNLRLERASCRIRRRNYYLN